MLVISFITYKGGAGKSTLAFSTAVAAKQAGENVAILALDQQAATAAWAGTRARTDMFVESAAVDDLDSRIAEIAEAGYSLCILDCGIELGGSKRVIRASDLCIIPSRPNLFDLRAGAETWRRVTDLGKPAAFLLNQCPPARQIARIQEGARTLQDSGALLSPMISARVDFQDAARAGLGVTELHASGAAAQEIRALWETIRAQLQPQAPVVEVFEEEPLKAAA
jgi:chromosome partitioning protein